MTVCGDSPRAGIVGCGATWNGTSAAHCVAKCEHSKHPDGRCHETFTSNTAADMHWVAPRRGAAQRHTDPARVLGLVLVEMTGGTPAWTPKKNGVNGG